MFKNLAAQVWKQGFSVGLVTPKKITKNSNFRSFASAADKIIRPKEPVRVTVTGAAGQVGYQLLFRIASGQMLGPNQPVILQLLELTPALKSLEGVVMELKDCAFPLLRGVVQTDSVQKAFEGADYGVLVGAKTGKGMTRADLLKENAKTFADQGKALNSYSNRNVRVVVVADPVNTSAMILSHHAPKMPTKQITGLSRLDHNRSVAQLAEKANAKSSDVERFGVWGNISSTIYPDISHCHISGKLAKEVIKEEPWMRDTFLATVRQRGTSVANIRNATSAASTASGAIDHMYDWMLSTNGRWTSMCVCSDGSYGVDKGLWYSFPLVTRNGEYMIVPNLPQDDFTKEQVDITRRELVSERDAVASVLR